MTLSEERQNLVEMEIDRYCSEYSLKQTTELKEIYLSSRRRGQWKSRLNNKHADHMLQLGRFIIGKYREAYSQERKTFTENDLPILLAKITYRFNKETADRASKVPEFSGSSSEMESLLGNIKSVLEQELIIVITTTALSPNTVEDKIEREKRILARMYLIAGEQTARNINFDEIAQIERLGPDEVLDICNRLDSQGYIKIISLKLAHLTPECTAKFFENQSR